MNENRDYRFADLTSDDVSELQRLERKLSAETGSSITLIAYSKENDTVSFDSCRAGMDD